MPIARAVPIRRPPASGRRRPSASRRGSARRSAAADKRERPLVLVVDDIREQRELYDRYLRFVGFQVALARDGVEAVAKAVELGPDIIVMDLSMPGVDGFEATRMLKALAATEAIPVVALTAYADSLPREWAEEAGCAEYLSKPLLPYDLAEQLWQLLRRRSA